MASVTYLSLNVWWHFRSAGSPAISSTLLVKQTLRPIQKCRSQVILTAQLPLWSPTSIMRGVNQRYGIKTEWAVVVLCAPPVKSTRVLESRELLCLASHAGSACFSWRRMKVKPHQASLPTSPHSHTTLPIRRHPEVIWAWSIGPHHFCPFAHHFVSSDILWSL